MPEPETDAKSFEAIDGYATCQEPELVKGCLKGDPAAIKQLVERFQQDVFGLCVRMLGNRHDAEDCTQDVFLRTFRSLAKWDPTRPLRPWITTICVNQCRTRMTRRKNRPAPAPLIEDVAEKQPPPDDGREVADAVRDAVDGLRDDYKAVFVMFHEQGRNYEEIAQAIDRPVGTVKTWLHRSRVIVLDYLKRFGLVPDEKDHGTV